eukprot:915073-Amphidinium_carterae.1
MARMNYQYDWHGLHEQIQDKATAPIQVLSTTSSGRVDVIMWRLVNTHVLVAVLPLYMFSPPALRYMSPKMDRLVLH